MWGFFLSVTAELCLLPLLLLGMDRLLLSLFWCDCSVFFLGHLPFSAACHAAFYHSRVPHLADSGWLTYSSGRLLWGWRCLGTGVLLVFYLVAQLPLPLLPLRGSAPFLAPVCWSTTAVEPCCWVNTPLGFLPCVSAAPLFRCFPLAGSATFSGSSLLVYYCGGALWLGWRCLSCVTWFSTMCRVLPPGPGSLCGFPCSGLPWRFSGHRVSVLLLPW